jgi:hypothetical protein
MSEELPSHERDLLYLYENALGQIVSIGHFGSARVPPDQYKETAFILDRVKEIAEHALNHDFRAIYPGHTEQFHKEIRDRNE